MNVCSSAFTTTRVLIYCILSLSSLSSFAQVESKSALNIYYVAVGSGHYVKDTAKNRLEAINSAKVMSDFFKKIGGRGEELLSTEDNPVTKQRLLKAIYDIKQSIRDNNASHPFLIVYFMGHGLGSAEFDQYVALGDYDFKTKLTFDVLQENPLFKNSAISADDLSQSLYTFTLDENKRSVDSVFTSEGTDAINREENRIYETHHASRTPIADLNRHMNSTMPQIIDLARRLKRHEITKEEFDRLSQQKMQQMEEEGKSGKAALHEILDLREQKTGLNYSKFGKLKSEQGQEPVVLRETSKSDKHVPYIILIDSCSDGIEGGTEFSARKTKEWIDTAAKSTNRRFSNRGLPDQAMEWLRRMSTDYQVKASRGATFKEHGAVFFAVNPGGVSRAVSEDPFAKNEDKTGFLADTVLKEYEVLARANDAIPLGKFLDALEHKGGDRRSKSTDQKPFYWFDNELQVEIKNKLLNAR